MSEVPKKTVSVARVRPVPQPRVEGRPGAIAGGGAAGGRGAGLDQGLERQAAMPAWMEGAMPWGVSVMGHLGVLLLLLFALYVQNQAGRHKEDEEEIIIPSAVINDAGKAGGIVNPGMMNDPTRQAAQDRIKTMSEEGWSQKASETDVQKFLGTGDSGDVVADAIALGGGGSIGGSGKNGLGGDGGPLAQFGVAGGGGGMGPRSNFYGTGGNAMRVVFILDKSGGMVDSFPYLKINVDKSLGRFLPIQSFAVIMCGVYDVEANGSYTPPFLVGGVKTLLPATKRNTEMVMAAMNNARLVAEGRNDDTLKPFEDSFRDAFALKPQLIYFLTDGAFDPKLSDVIKKLNSDRKVHINTIAFGGSRKNEGKEFADTTHDYRDLLKNLARDNNGVFKWVTDEEIGD